MTPKMLMASSMDSYAWLAVPHSAIRQVTYTLAADISLHEFRVPHSY
jgi:hypothetical protein